MLKYYPLCQYYARFLIVPIMLIIMLAYLTQVYSSAIMLSVKLINKSICKSHLAAFLVHHYKNKKQPNDKKLGFTYIHIILLINFTDIMMTEQYNYFTWLCSFFTARLFLHG